MTNQLLLGIAGDTLTFLGAAVLAFDAIWREKDFYRNLKLLKTVTSPALARVEVQRNGIVIKNAEDVELVSIRTSVKRAVYGTGILTVGFLCLLLARFLEVDAREGADIHSEKSVLTR